MNCTIRPTAVATLMLAAAAALGVSSAAAAETSRVIVAYKAGQGEAARQAIVKAGGKVLVNLPRLDAVAVRLPASRIDALRKHAAVDLVEDDVLRYPMRASSKMARPSALVEAAPYGISAVQADQVSFNAAGAKKVCIIDSGYDINHEDLQNTNVTGENLTSETDWFDDKSQHGTHVAGTIAALGGNGVGVVGVVPTGTLPLHIMKVFDASGSAPSSVIMQGVEKCRDAGADIISMSLGGGLPNLTELKLYAQLARGNVLVIAAAGNGGNTRKSYPASYGGVMSVAAVDENNVHADFSQVNNKVEISAPGVDVQSTVPMGTGQDFVTTVDGVGYNSVPLEGTPAAVVSAPLYDFGLGTAVDAGAAGKTCLIQRGDISFSDKVLNCQTSGGVAAVIYNNTAGRLYGTLNGVATTIPSTGITAADGATLLTKAGLSATVDTSNFVVSNYAFFNGTSMATPHVSGVAALVWSNFPNCTAKQIRKALTTYAMDLGPAGKDNEYGYGLVQAKATYDGIMANGCPN